MTDQMSGSLPGPDRPNLSLTPDDVGRRVSVRRILGIRDERPVFGDVLGVLESWDGGTLTIRRRGDEVVTFPEEALVAGKTVPPPPPPRH